MQGALIHSTNSYLTYAEALVLIQNISFLANASKTAVRILTLTVCTDARDFGTFI